MYKGKTVFESLLHGYCCTCLVLRCLGCLICLKYAKPNNDNYGFWQPGSSILVNVIDFFKHKKKHCMTMS